MYRINELIKLDRRIYHSQDLAVLWGIANKNTLYTTLKRYVQKGILIRIYKGLFSTVPLDKLDPLELGKAIVHNYAYLSAESVLAQAGIISQAVYGYTFVSSKTMKITIGKNNYIFRKMNDLYLYNPTGIIGQKNGFIASKERAVADMLYFAPDYHFDLSSSIDWKSVKDIQKKVGYL